MANELVNKGIKLRAIELTYIAMFSTLMMIGANITTFIPFLVIGGVPITLQSFFAILAGILLGSRLGALSMIVYMFTGLVGAPIFSRFSGGPSALLSPTFGFVLSFIITAYIVGLLIERKKTKSQFYLAAFVGLLINYIIGTIWLYFAFKFWASAPANFSFKTALMLMVPPFPKDIVLTFLAGYLSYRMYPVLMKNKLKNNQNIVQSKEKLP